MQPIQIFESVLYAADLPAAEEFYSNLLGLARFPSHEDMLAFKTPTGMLLIFNPEKSSLPGRPLPSHGARGPGHLAFRVPASDLPAWRERLTSQGVAIEHQQDWEEGGTSLYFRDPAGNSLELASGQLWGGGWD